MPHPALMQQLWNATEPLTARQLRERLYPDAARSQHGTVQRLLQRLAAKGFVERDARLPVHLFRAAVPRAAYAGEQLQSLVATLSGGSLAPALGHLVDTGRIPPRELARLRDALDASRRSRRG